MTPTDIPVLRQVLEAGSDDHVYDAFMICGPVLIALVATYAVAFFGYLLHTASRDRSASESTTDSETR
jgi:uncharacterized membrane protein YraQ (UPF0718 family)